MKLLYKTSIDCAHFIPDSEDLLTKKCARVHGHTYNFEVGLDLDSLKKYLHKEFIDFQIIKKLVDSILDDWDHKDLSNYGIHTVEQLCLMFKGRLMKELKWQNERAITVRLFETAKYGVEC